MIQIADKSYPPTAEEMAALTGVPLFDELYQYMARTYQPIVRIEYSGDNVLLGWNLKYKKAGRTLCTVYPREGHFPMLLVVGQREKERVERLLPSFSAEFQQIYRTTQEGMGQRWLLLDFAARTPLYDDALAVIDIRRHGK